MDKVCLILILAFFLDLLLGDPVYKFHPVRIIGKIISIVENILWKWNLFGRFGGVLLVITVLGIGLTFSWWGIHLLQQIHPWFDLFLSVFLVYSSIAFRDLLRHARKISFYLLQEELDQARKAVGEIVGRDTKKLNQEGLVRATIETTAENFVDGLLSPLFWYILGGFMGFFLNGSPDIGAVIGIVSFRIVNTLDSMVGYRNKRYLTFGTMAAKLDDLMNFIPARLGILVFFLASMLTGLSARGCWKVAWRDRLKHQSPNAGHPESCVAGALGIRIGGPTIYKYGTVQKPWIGDGISKLSTQKIEKSCRLVFMAGVCAFTASIILLRSYAGNSIIYFY